MACKNIEKKVVKKVHSKDKVKIRVYLTKKSMILFSVIAPQHPRKATSTMIIPATRHTFAIDM